MWSALAPNFFADPKDRILEGVAKSIMTVDHLTIL